MKIDWRKKLSSRKFWAAVSGVVISVMVIIGSDGQSQEKIAGAITATGTLAIYILSEGAVDKAATSTNDDKKEETEDDG